MTEEENKLQDLPFPKGTWFEEPEVDKEPHTIDYSVGGEPKQIAFLVRSVCTTEMKLMTAENEEVDEATGIKQIDQSAFNDDFILRTFSYMENGEEKNLTRDQLDGIKRNKKSGLYGSMLQLALKQSDAIPDIQKIEKQKN